MANCTNSRSGGLGGARGDEGMLSHGDLVGSGRFEGVRGGAVRSSERAAIASSVGRLERDVFFVLEGGGCGCAYGEESEWEMGLRGVRRAAAAGEEEGAGSDAAAAAAVAAELRVALRSLWRRFWNHIVTTLGSLCDLIHDDGMNEQKKTQKKRERDNRTY
jgi:hypothetical protein